MADIDIDRLVLVVIGAELRAEAADRPLGYRLRDTIAGWIAGRVDADPPPLVPLVISDVWYLNNDELHTRPVIAIGGPGVNALSGFLYDKLQPALQIENQLIIQLDVEMQDLRASLWGMNHRQTAAAVELFEQRYLDGFMRAALDEKIV
ncbi:MAG: hypothetical protein GC159_22255 [Phycisphaera sp.]|nr:hypothetical protein [Phycisphaera sp.]